MDETAIPDERLELIFTCCHPALALDAQVVLSLPALGGLSGDEIARAFIVPSRRWRSDSCPHGRRSRPPASPFRCPRPTCFPTGSQAVLAVVYVIFNDGYGGCGDLGDEAIRLGPRFPN
jgi:RNA polymerase sigma-70 factor (ECF subfamily)